MATKTKKGASKADCRAYYIEMGWGPKGPGPLVPFFSEEGKALRAAKRAKPVTQTKRSK